MLETIGIWVAVILSFLYVVIIQVKYVHESIVDRNYLFTALFVGSLLYMVAGMTLFFVYNNWSFF